ncbi:MAG TPA: hypothetical protein PLI43_11375 [Albidovulum sp.]|uniref:hypothetical protein n=1 Tax=Albidovulum sp. TaxID=1872424 RepID=UPI002C83D5F6|nr:hypothetical protein [Albidovulum sp.]
MDANHQAATGESYILFISDAVILQDIAEEIGLRKPGAAILIARSLGEFMTAVLPAARVRAVFVELELLGPYWEEARDRMRSLGARIVLMGRAVEDLADGGVHLAGVQVLLRPYSAEDVARHIRGIPQA